MILHNNEVREKFILFFQTSLFRINIGKDFILKNISQFWYGRKKLCYSDKSWEKLLLRVVATMPQSRTPSPDQKHSTW